MLRDALAAPRQRYRFGYFFAAARLKQQRVQSHDLPCCAANSPFWVKRQLTCRRGLVPYDYPMVKDVVTVANRVGEKCNPHHFSSLIII
jgi:hypothetical protein